MVSWIKVLWVTYSPLNSTLFLDSRHCIVYWPWWGCVWTGGVLKPGASHPDPLHLDEMPWDTLGKRPGSKNEPYWEVPKCKTKKEKKSRFPPVTTQWIWRARIIYLADIHLWFEKHRLQIHKNMQTTGKVMVSRKMDMWNDNDSHKKNQQQSFQKDHWQVISGSFIPLLPRKVCSVRVNLILIVSWNDLWEINAF